MQRIFAPFSRLILTFFFSTGDFCSFHLVFVNHLRAPQPPSRPDYVHPRAPVPGEINNRENFHRSGPFEP